MLRNSKIARTVYESVYVVSVIEHQWKLIEKSTKDCSRDVFLEMVLSLWMLFSINNSELWIGPACQIFTT